MFFDSNDQLVIKPNKEPFVNKQHQVNGSRFNHLLVSGSLLLYVSSLNAAMPKFSEEILTFNSLKVFMVESDT